MNKVIRVAKTEYLDFIRTKAFILSVVLMPVFTGGAIGIQILLQDQTDLSDRRFAVVDHTGYLFQALEEAAEQRNQYAIFAQDDGGKKQMQPRFLPQRTDADAVELSERVKEGKLFAYLILEKDLGEGVGGEIAYHTEAPTYQLLPNWIRETINGSIRAKRFADAGIDQVLVGQLNQFVALRKYGLVERAASGAVTKAEQVNEISAFGVPMGAVILMFMVVMMAAPALLNGILEEKMQRIAEILVASVSPFELFLGKLLGIVGVSWTLSSLYLSGITFLAFHFDFADAIPLSLYLWFIVFQVLALLIFGSIFMGLGAACSELSDAQSMMMPAMLMAMLPMFVLSVVLQEPDSPFSVIISLFPPCTPFLMLMRIAIPPGPALWEIILGVALTLGFTLVCIWAAGKVFRIGILAQGQAPSFRKLFTWILSK